MNNQNSSNDSKNNEQSKNNESSKNKNVKYTKSVQKESNKSNYLCFKQMSDSQYKTLLIVMINVYILVILLIYV